MLASVPKEGILLGRVSARRLADGLYHHQAIFTIKRGGSVFIVVSLLISLLKVFVMGVVFIVAYRSDLTPYTFYHAHWRAGLARFLGATRALLLNVGRFSSGAQADEVLDTLVEAARA